MTYIRRAWATGYSIKQIKTTFRTYQASPILSMAMIAFTSVSDLKTFKTMWKIRIKVIQLWKQYSAAGGLTIEMVLVDANVSVNFF